MTEIDPVFFEKYRKKKRGKEIERTAETAADLMCRLAKLDRFNGDLFQQTYARMESSDRRRQLNQLVQEAKYTFSEDEKDMFRSRLQERLKLAGVLSIEAR